MADCKAKGRIARGPALGNRQGENGSAAKLDWPSVRAIRASTAPSKDLARQYGVDPSNINHIRRHKTWKEA